MQEALTLYDEMSGSHNRVHALALVGHVALVRGDASEAARAIGASLAGVQHAMRALPQNELAEWLPFLRPIILDCVVQAVFVLVALGDRQSAATLLGAGEAQNVLQPANSEAPLQAALDSTAHQLHAQLPGTAIDHAWRAGRVLSLEQMLAEQAQRLLAQLKQGFARYVGRDQRVPITVPAHPSAKRQAWKLVGPRHQHRVKPSRRSSKGSTSGSTKRR